VSYWQIDVKELGGKRDAWVSAAGPDGERVELLARDLLAIAHHVSQALLTNAEHEPSVQAMSLTLYPEAEPA
jgi:hypothetical protein